MAICVQTRCSDCGTVVDQVLHSDDAEVRCPECSRNVPNLDREEFNSVERTQKSQMLLGIFAVAFLIAVPVLLTLWMGLLTSLKPWISNADKSVVREADSTWLIAALVCLVVAAFLGGFASRKRYVVDF